MSTPTSSSLPSFDSSDTPSFIKLSNSQVENGGDDYENTKDVEKKQTWKDIVTLEQIENFLEFKANVSKGIIKYAPLNVWPSDLCKSKSVQTLEILNYMFYTNRFISRPENVRIDDFLENWNQDYEKLEDRHGYIQWIFPIPAKSPFNSNAQPLQDVEIRLLKQHPEFKTRLIRAFSLMLDFYGMKLVDDKTGKIERSDHQFLIRFRSWCSSSCDHNFQRITRILTTLGLFDLHHMRMGFFNFILSQWSQKLLLACRKSAVEYWWCVDEKMIQDTQDAMQDFDNNNNDDNNTNTINLILQFKKSCLVERVLALTKNPTDSLIDVKISR